MVKLRVAKIVQCLLVVSLLYVAGCTPPGPKFSGPVEIPPGKSVVYFYRQANFFGASSVPGLEANGREILDSLPTWSWWPYYIEPGQYHFEPTLFGLYKKDTADIVSRQPGERFYVRMKLNLGYVGLSQVSESQALSEMTRCYQVVE